MKFKFTTTVILFLGCVGFAPAAVQGAPLSGPRKVLTLKFDRIAATLPAGQVFANGKVGLLCVPYEKHSWGAGRDVLDIDAFSEAFHKEAVALGLPVAGDPTSLFGDTGVADADLLVGASIYQLQMDVCAPWAANLNSVKGSALLGIEWQVFSKSQRRVVYRLRTIADFREKKATQGGLYMLLYSAFRANVQRMAAEQQFRTMLGI